MAEKQSADLARLQGVAELLLLEQRLRQAATGTELGYRLVNETTHLCRSDTAALWLEGGRHGRLEAVANLPEPAPDAPFTQWMRRAGAALARTGSGGVREVGAADLPDKLRAQWDEFLAPAGVWVPLTTPAGRTLGGLLLARSLAWQESEKRILGRLGETAAHALEALHLRRRRKLRPNRRVGKLIAWAVAAGLAAAMFVPVPLSVLAPAEVAPLDPFVVRAPLDGVIRSVDVRANQPVASGETLLSLDETDLAARLDVALQDLEIARAEYRQAQQTSMRDREASSRINVLAARIAQAEADVAYVRSLLDRIEVRAERPGIAIVPDRQALIGKPVRIGERLMTIADPGSVQVEAWLPVADAIPLPADGGAELYLNTDAGRGLPATVESIDYQAQVSPGGILAFRVVAAFAAEAAPPRVGQRGTLRLEGETVPLFQFLFRRPWAALRPWLGL
jgi:GAF domain-containing protein